MWVSKGIEYGSDLKKSMVSVWGYRPGRYPAGWSQQLGGRVMRYGCWRKLDINASRHQEFSMYSRCRYCEWLAGGCSKSDRIPRLLALVVKFVYFQKPVVPSLHFLHAQSTTSKLWSRMMVLSQTIFWLKSDRQIELEREVLQSYPKNGYGKCFLCQTNPFSVGARFVAFGGLLFILQSCQRVLCTRCRY